MPRSLPQPHSPAPDRHESFSAIYKVPGEGGINERGRLLRGCQHRVALGNWPIIRLPKASEKACKMIAEAAAGRDGRASRRENNLIRHDNSFDVIRQCFVDRQWHQMR
jgi:hypothetical protein